MMYSKTFFVSAEFAKKALTPLEVAIQPLLSANISGFEGSTFSTNSFMLAHIWLNSNLTLEKTHFLIFNRISKSDFETISGKECPIIFSKGN